MKFILYLVLFYFGFKFLSRLFYLYLVNKVKQKQTDFYNSKDINKNKEGEVSINKMPNKNSKNSDKLGDYVDYEEID
ncbi:MAG: DUF4834 domain-containing protein [Flavobacteriaceae bacterium]|jgi:hypothetical protein|tara:strand:- start:596 stop:826 length:231 start_codon:yes stop_codon:yes gene_type:complete